VIEANTTLRSPPVVDRHPGKAATKTRAMFTTYCWRGRWWYGPWFVLVKVKSPRPSASFSENTSASSSD